MSKDIVIHLTSTKSKTTLASVRIAKFISSTLNLPIKDCSSGKSEKYNTVLLVNGPPAFCNWREELAGMVEKCDRVVWIQNDYSIYPPSQVNKVMRKRGWINDKGHVKPPISWTTIPHKATSDTDSYVNWNQLTYSPHPIVTRKNRSLFYYGAFRTGREYYFKKYMNTDTYNIVVSSSLPASKKFLLLNPTIEVHPPFEDLSLYAHMGATVYMEDLYSHRNYCSPANRFYECLSYGIPMLFDDNSIGTMVKAGMPEAEIWKVSSSEDVKRFLKSGTTIANRQREIWHRDYVKELRAQLKRLYKGVAK